MRIDRLTAVLLLLSTLAIAQSEHPPAPTTFVRAGRLFDVRTGAYLPNQGLLIEGDRIKEVGPLTAIQSHVPLDAVIVDLSKAVVLTWTD